ncbi:restriction endonuclease [Arthrobacter sp. B1805]|uniref:restriction endonuclease n=1 Tax=Arthrobacter sp. B1805 TaxID=2058892 RepID=UPI00215742A0|nr:restriction endonuclease [Arthrobacter sp. B1805]
MRTPEAIALSQLKEEFDAYIAIQDWERALDLMVLIARTFWLSENQSERRAVLRRIDQGTLSANWVGFRQDEELERIAQSLYTECARFFPYYLSDSCGASRIRRSSWLDSWDYLPLHWLRGRSPLMHEHSDRLGEYFEDQDEETWISAMVTAEKVWSECRLDPDSPHGRVAGLKPEEDTYESPSILDEYDTFIASGDIKAALDLLVIAYRIDLDDDIKQIVVASKPRLLDTWVPEPGIQQLRCRLWIHVYSELKSDLDREGFLDDQLVDLDETYPALKFPLTPWAAQGSRIQQTTPRPSPTIEPATTKAEPPNGLVADILEAFEKELSQKGSAVEADETPNAGESTVAEESEDEERFRALEAAAYRHLTKHGLPMDQASTVAENSVLKAHSIWLRHASITGTWVGTQNGSGYGKKIESDLKKWSEVIAAEYWPKPKDQRKLAPERDRRIYEYVWAWVVGGTLVGAVLGLGDFLFGAVVLCAGAGWLFSWNYSSTPTPALEPLPDPHKEARDRLARSLYEVGMHACREFDKHQYSSHLTPNDLRAIVHGAWQPQGPRPPLLEKCTPREAEFLCATWMRFLGSTNCEVTQAARDGGADIISSEHVSEVKHHATPIGVQYVRQIFGVATSARKKAAFFSLNGYTASAQQFADANAIALFKYNPAEGTLLGGSKAGRAAIERGLSSKDLDRNEPW